MQTINPKKEETHQLTAQEAFAFFDASVRERLGISAEEFLAHRDDFKCNPHYDSLIFMLPLVEHDSKK